MNNLNPEQPKGSKEAAFLTGLLGGALGPKSVTSREAVLTQQVTDAVATLDSMKQVVINHRFGLDGHPVLSHEEIAKRLTSSLSRELRESIAGDQGISADQVVISADRVSALETEAFRDLRSPKRTT